MQPLVRHQHQQHSPPVGISQPPPVQQQPQQPSEAQQQLVGQHPTMPRAIAMPNKVSTRVPRHTSWIIAIQKGSWISGMSSQSPDWLHSCSNLQKTIPVVMPMSTANIVITMEATAKRFITLVKCHTGYFPIGRTRFSTLDFRARDNRDRESTCTVPNVSTMCATENIALRQHYSTCYVLL